MDYTLIYDRYNGELRPLISEFEGREEQFEEPLLENMAYVVDELSMCVQSDDSSSAMIHYKKAQQNLEEALVNSYKYLVVSHHKRLRKFKRRFSHRQMEQFNNGKFVGEFCDNSKKAVESVRRGRKCQCLVDAMDDFKQAYELYSKIELLISDFESEGIVMKSRITGLLWTSVRIALSVVISVAVAYVCSIF